jgi:hypothetical protein
LLNLVSPIIEIFGFALLRIKSAYTADEFIVFVLTSVVAFKVSQLIISDVISPPSIVVPPESKLQRPFGMRKFLMLKINTG